MKAMGRTAKDFFGGAAVKRFKKNNTKKKKGWTSALKGWASIKRKSKPALKPSTREPIRVVQHRAQITDVDCNSAHNPYPQQFPVPHHFHKKDSSLVISIGFDGKAWGWDISGVQPITDFFVPSFAQYILLRIFMAAN